jgi:hypothetical protein
MNKEQERQGWAILLVIVAVILIVFAANGLSKKQVEVKESYRCYDKAYDNGVFVKNNPKDYMMDDNRTICRFIPKEENKQ